MVSMDILVSLCKRRGFIFQSSEIYGGINGFWDFGPVGCEFKRRIKDSWWKRMVQERDDMVGVDTSIIAHPQTWIASGHVDNFNDPMVDCKSCKRRFRADDILAEEEGTRRCPECGGELTDAREFNLMFQTHVGATVDSASLAYLRPETCQSIFTQFKNVQMVSRKKIPFGIAQIGKAFRNEITPRNFIFRSREFEQMEVEFFCHRDEADKWYKYWTRERMDWFLAIGISKKNLRFRPHDRVELAHYAQSCIDIEFQMPFGWSELEGIANRADYDLKQHMKVSGKDMTYFNEASKERFIPYVVETSLGVDRTALAVLVDAYREEEVRGEKRVVMGFNPSIAPVQVGVLPLSTKLKEPAKKIELGLKRHFVSEYDESGSIGRRYRRHDEIGTPFCVTYDFDSEQDHAVTVRDRDSMQQDRIPIDRVPEYLRDKFESS